MKMTEKERDEFLNIILSVPEPRYEINQIVLYEERARNMIRQGFITKAYYSSLIDGWFY